MKRTNLSEKHTRSLLNTILSWYIPESHSDNRYKRVSDCILSRYFTMMNTRGSLSAVSDMKSARLVFTRWLAGKPIKSGRVGCPISKIDGLPKVIPLDIRRSLTRSDRMFVRWVLSLLTISRQVKGGTPVSLDSITQPRSPTRGRTISDYEILTGVKLLGLKPTTLSTDHKFKWIGKAGPNGISIGSSLGDLEQFLETFQEEAEVLGGDSLHSVWGTLLRWESSIDLISLMKGKKSTESLRKLAVKEDSEAKSRIFAIFDYWSQTLLDNLHSWGYRSLRKIPSDWTFNQLGGFSTFGNGSRKWYYSMDLKSATDRFPIEIQERFLAYIFGSRVAAAWKGLMVKEPFRFKGQSAAFAVGQPLGGKSSWAIFSLCHHLVVQIAGIRCNQKPVYMILGDDIVIQGGSVAREYRRIMKHLGVVISEQKTHVSRDTFEFAKGWKHKGENYSPFPIVGVIQTWNKPLELANVLLFTAVERGWPLPFGPSALSQFADQLYNQDMIWASRMRYYLADRFVTYFAILGFVHTNHYGWARYLAQTVGWVINSEFAVDRVTKLIKLHLKNNLQNQISSIKSFAWKIVRDIPDKLTFVDTDSDDMIITGSTDNYGSLHLAPHLTENIPLFQALEREAVSSKEVIDSLDDIMSIDCQALRDLKLLPMPQLKGLVPQRIKVEYQSLTSKLSIFKTILKEDRDFFESLNLIDFKPLKVKIRRESIFELESPPEVIYGMPGISGIRKLF